MPTLELAKPAAICALGGTRYAWKCPACLRFMGEIAGTRLIVRAERRVILIPNPIGTEQICAKCQTSSRLDSLTV